MDIYMQTFTNIYMDANEHKQIFTWSHMNIYKQI